MKTQIFGAWNPLDCEQAAPLSDSKPCLTRTDPCEESHLHLAALVLLSLQQQRSVTLRCCLSDPGEPRIQFTFSLCETDVIHSTAFRLQVLMQHVCMLHDERALQTWHEDLGIFFIWIIATFLRWGGILVTFCCFFFLFSFLQY